MTDTVVPPEAAIPTGTAPAEVEAWGRFDRWASLGLTIIGVLAVVGVAVLASAVVGSTSPGFTTLALASQAAFAALAFWVAIDLARSSPWARQAGVWLLWLTVIAGVTEALLALARGDLTVPVAAIGAGWILSLGPWPVRGLDRTASRRATAVGLAAVLLVVAPSVTAWAATNPQSPFVATADDFALELTVVCEGDPLAMPTRVTATLRWSWTTRDVFSMTSDTAGVTWTSSQELDGTGSQWVIASQSASSPEFWQGGGIGPSFAAAEQELSFGQSATWGVEGDPAPDGWVSVELVPRSPDPAREDASGDLYVRGVYAHLDRWTEVEFGGCEWVSG